ncbi:MAG TPA: hypothetical protein VGV18_02915 [Verrucomicrobiae bacterium]|nr:hypothetical protein [Verrucomicrobiae bacterium]
MDKVFGISAFAVGVYAALGIWFSGLRGDWKGTKITMGALSCTGLALFFISFGVVWLWGDKVLEDYGVWLAIPIFSGGLLLTIGQVLDSRKYARTSGTQAEPLVAPERRWLFFVLGILLFLLLVKAIFFYL